MPAEVQAEVAGLAGAVAAQVPAKAADNLLLATWNLRAFGSLTPSWNAGAGSSPKRDWRAVASSPPWCHSSTSSLSKKSGETSPPSDS